MLIAVEPQLLIDGCSRTRNGNLILALKRSDSLLHSRITIRQTPEEDKTVGSLKETRERLTRLISNKRDGYKVWSNAITLNETLVNITRNRLWNNGHIV